MNTEMWEMINAFLSCSHGFSYVSIITGYLFNMAIWHSNSNCPSVAVHLSPFLNIRICIGRALNEEHVLNDILQSAFISIFLNENKRKSIRHF